MMRRGAGGPLGWAIVAGVLVLGAAGVAYVAWRPDPDRLWEQAHAAMGAGQFGRADALLERLKRRRTPTDRDWMLRAQADMALGRHDRALEALNRVPDGSPLAPQARLLAGQLELRRYHLPAAEAQFLRALELDPRLVQARRELIYMYGIQLRRRALAEQFRALSEQVPLSFDNAFHWSLTRNVLWEPLELAGLLRRFLEGDPEDRPSRLALADSYRALNQLDQAEAVLAPLPDSDPDARAARARIALDRGDLDALESLLADGPEDHPELARLRGRLALSRGDAKAAVRHFRKALAAEPDDRDALFGLGNALRLAGQPDAAEPYLEAARKYDALGSLIQKASAPEARDDPALWHELGAACEAIGRYPEARAWYGLALARNPLDADAQRALFRLRERSGRGSADGPQRSAAGDRPERGAAGSPRPSGL